ncbi:hypothetical protein J3459_022238 [Metarhizium acridum]|nr:hypothetical protein J3459_022238 [Metarhizium acridum]
MLVNVVPASTRTGRAVIRSLLASQDPGVEIQAIYRDAARAPAEFTSLPNFTAVAGDIADESSLNFTGSDAVVAITPPVLIAGEIKTNNIAERVLATTDIPEIIFIRCAYFMENWTVALDTLRGPEPFFYSTVTPLEWKIPMVAVGDVGAVIASQALKQESSPRRPYVFELHGPRMYSPLDVQVAFSDALGETGGHQARGKGRLARVL